MWYLESLQKSLSDDHWREAVTGVRRWKKGFQTFLPGLALRLDRLFYDMAIRKANMRWLNELAINIDPPHWDPRWFRARAMISEHNEEDDDIETVQGYWLAYLEDLASLPDLKPGERALAQAMVWQRLGGLWAEEAEADEEECQCIHCRMAREAARVPVSVGVGDDERAGMEREHEARAKTIECLSKAIDLAPGLSAAYHALAGNYVEWEQEDAAAEVHRRLLAHVPDDLDSIVFLFHYHRKRDEALAARDYALQARRLKPASDEMLGMVLAGHFLAAQALHAARPPRRGPCRTGRCRGGRHACGRSALRGHGPPGDGRTQGRPDSRAACVGWTRPWRKATSRPTSTWPFRSRPSATTCPSNSTACPSGSWIVGIRA